jgi:hypothetical protein
LPLLNPDVNTVSTERVFPLLNIAADNLYARYQAGQQRSAGIMPPLLKHVAVKAAFNKCPRAVKPLLTNNAQLVTPLLFIVGITNVALLFFNAQLGLIRERC